MKAFPGFVLLTVLGIVGVATIGSCRGEPSLQDVLDRCADWVQLHNECVTDQESMLDVEDVCPESYLFTQDCKDPCSDYYNYDCGIQRTICPEIAPAGHHPDCVGFSSCPTC